MKPQIRKNIKKRRFGELMLAQQRISLKKNMEKKGRVMEVFVEGRIPEDDVYIGRSRGDAPQVDGFVFFHSNRELMTGSFVQVLITEASEYDLHGSLL